MRAEPSVDAIALGEGAPPASPGSAAARLLRPLDIAVAAVMVAALLGELGVVVANVISRTVGHSGFLWTVEVAQLALSVITFVGGAASFRHGYHTPVRAIVDRLPPKAQAVAVILADWLVFAAAIAVGAASVPVIRTSWGEATPILGLPAALMIVPLLLCMVLLLAYAAERLAGRERRLRYIIGAGLLALFVFGYVTEDFWQGVLQGNPAIYLSLGILFVTVLAGLPVGFALMLAAGGYLWASGASPLMALPQNMVNGTSNFVLLAVPFFIFAGLVMERGGISLRLVRFVRSLVGHFRGGLLQVMVGSMYLVSGISGSKAADVAAVGSVMRDMLRSQDITDEEGAGVLAASAAMGETVPPSIAMLVLGSITNLSVGALFIAGLVPAAVIALCLMALIWLRARRSTNNIAWAGWGTLARTGLAAILPLGMPVMLFAGILLGIATPTEVSAFAVLYGLALAILGYRAMGWRDFLRTVVDTAMLTGMVLFILAAAAGFSWTLTIAYVPQQLVTLLQSMHASHAVFLIGSVLLLVVIGTLLEGLPALNVLAPLLLPIAAQIGISQLHYGVVLVIAMGIGAFLPPAGVGFYVCCAVMRTSVEAASRAMLPYLAVLFLGLMIVTFIPAITLFLPHWFGFPG